MKKQKVSEQSIIYDYDVDINGDLQIHLL